MVLCPGARLLVDSHREGSEPITSVLSALGDALKMAGSMTWQITWSLILGFTLSAIVQAVVRRETITRMLGDDRPATLAKATGLGIASSSCSYAAVAMARSLFRKGSSFVAAIVFEVAEDRPGHRAREALRGLLSRRVDQLRADEEPEEHGHQDDDDRTADELRERELPTEQQRQDDAQLDDQVGARDLEDDRRDEARPFAEQRARHRHGGVRARRAGDAQPGGLGECRRPIVAEHARDGLAAYDGLDDRRQREPEDQRPGDLPGHRPGHLECVAEGGEDGRDQLAPFSVKVNQQTGATAQDHAGSGWMSSQARAERGDVTRQHRVLVVGLGTIAQTHLKVLGQRPDVVVVGGVDPVADAGDVPAYRTLDDALAADLAPTLVVVATPTETHVRIVREVVERTDALVLSEKPLATTQAEIGTLADIAERVRVAHHFAFSPEVEWARRYHSPRAGAGRAAC